MNEFCDQTERKTKWCSAQIYTYTKSLSLTIFSSLGTTFHISFPSRHMKSAVLKICDSLATACHRQAVASQQRKRYMTWLSLLPAIVPQNCTPSTDSLWSLNSSQQQMQWGHGLPLRAYIPSFFAVEWGLPNGQEKNNFLKAWLLPLGSPCRAGQHRPFWPKVRVVPCSQLIKASRVSVWTLH